MNDERADDHVQRYLVWFSAGPLEVNFIITRIRPISSEQDLDGIKDFLCTQMQQSGYDASPKNIVIKNIMRFPI